MSARETEQMSLQLVRDMAHFLWQLQSQGINLGPHVRLLAVHCEDAENYLSPSAIRFAAQFTVREFFGMGTSRGFYDSNVEAGKILSL